MVSVEEYRAERISNALNFLLERYNSEEALNVLCNFKYEDVHWSSTCRFPKFRHRGYRNWKNERKYSRGNRDKPVRIQLKRNAWNTYKMKTVGESANHLKCRESQCIEFQLVHEITHMIQFAEGRKASEVETTQNEIDYGRLNHSFLSKKLEPVE